MPILHTVERKPESNAPDFLFWCPGCECGHGVWTTHANGHTGATWSFNGSMDKPTFGPSILITGKSMTPAGLADYEEWRKAGCPDRKGQAFDSFDSRCHLHVVDGKLQYCTDCTHKYSGQTLDMMDF